MNFKTRLTTAIATGAVLLNALAPVALAQEVVVAGNGAFSDNTANVTTVTTTNVSQNNTAVVTNNVTSNADTGGNDANFNGGGDVVVSTGNATSNVAVSTGVNKNVLNLDCNCVTGGDTKVTIAGNNAFSDNTANVTDISTVNLTQNNNANVVNTVEADAETGDNDANFNGGGDVVIDTGDASATVLVSTDANLNSARIGGGTGAGAGNSVSILGNLAFTDNAANVTNLSSVTLSQNNTAAVTNDVEADAETGENDANFNGGGEVMIHTGDAKANVAVSNLLNFNSADVNCACLFGSGVKVTIAENGAFSDNSVNLTNLNSLLQAQLNYAAVTNDVEADAETGENDANFNGGALGEINDPAIHTGNATTNTGVSTSANVNSVGATTLTLPGNWNVGLSFNLVALWSALLSVVV